MLRAWLQLLRLPNVFTAAADVLMGYLVTQGSLAEGRLLWPLLAASCALYLAGMVLNDVFDLPVDAAERPQRPLPSGRVSLAAARFAGAALLSLGVAAGWLAAWLAGQWRPGLAASVLAALVLAYNAWLKKTPLGPPAMGACRALNVLLGMSAAALPWQAEHAVIAAGMGLYITGVTWLARGEAADSRRGQLLLAATVMAAGISLWASFPEWSAQPASLPYVNQTWYVLWGVLGLLIASRAVAAVADPSPRTVQAAVKHCILSLIMLDAVTCFAARGRFEALVIVALLPPAMFLGRFIYST